MKAICTLSSPIGPICLRSDGQALTGLALCRTAPEPGSSLPVFAAVKTWLELYFSGRDPGPVPVPLAPQGTEFQRRVWDLLLQIPYGESRTYGELARQLCRLTGVPRMSAQAVGSAVGRNPIAILIPCHRVLGSGGRLTGYACGLEIKRQLLDLEHIPYL